jgi:hypothetical protein
MQIVEMNREDGRKKEGVKKIGRGKRIDAGRKIAVAKTKIDSDLRSAAVLRSDPGWMKNAIARRSGTLRDLLGRELCRKRRGAMRKKLRETGIIGRIDRRCRRMLERRLLSHHPGTQG